MTAEMELQDCLPVAGWRASMRPRPNDRGNCAADAGADRIRLASMRPRPNDRGNAGVARILDGNGQASMRPRPNDRGNRQRSRTQTTGLRLQ